MSSLEYSRIVKWIISREIPEWFEGKSDIERIIDKHDETVQKRTEVLLKMRKDYQKKNEKEIQRFTPYIATYMIELARELVGEDPVYTEIIMYCYKTKYSIDINPRTSLPRKYGIGHTSGIVIGGLQECGDYLFVSHGVTIGRFGDKRPRIGSRVLLMPHCIIAGNTTIGDGAVISAGVRVINQDVPANSLVIAEGINGVPVIKEKKQDYIREYLVVR